jgi:ribonuclease-3
VPDPEKEQQDFIIEKKDSEQLTVDSYDYQKSESIPQQSNHNSPLSTLNSQLDDEFDLSDITHKEKSREDIIAEAEAAAFAEK